MVDGTSSTSGRVLTTGKVRMAPPDFKAARAKTKAAASAKAKAATVKARKARAAVH